MEKKYIELLSRQITKIDAEDFDLDAWKSSTIAILSRMFGENDAKIRQISDLKIDYSSWMLRDSNATYKPIETAKKKGIEILKAAIDEVEIFGVSKSHTTGILGKEFAKELQTMTKEQRKKHFEGMKKSQLVELLMQITP